MNLNGTARRQLGVTLLELVITMSIVAILLAIAIPSYRYVTNSNRVAGEVNGLLGDLQFARAEAIKEGQTVSACISNDGATCAAATTWQSGWIVFTDTNSDGAVDSPNDVVWRVQKAFTSGDTFVDNANQTKVLTFNRDGFAPGVAAGTLVTLHAATPSAASTRCLSISIIGVMSVQTYGGGCT